MSDGASFGVLLREHRLSRSLTQDRLAERAGVSAKAVAALESGRRKSPRLSTIALLVDALGLDEEQRAVLARAATASEGAQPQPRQEPVPRPQQPGKPDTDFPGVMRQYAFVGRPSERRALLEAWERGTRVVLLSGEAGAGKTRLAGEFAMSVAEGGTASVLWGRCTPDRLGAYEPFVEPIRIAAAGATTTAVAGATFGELKRIVPELGMNDAGASGPSIADPGVEQRLLFHAVETLLAQAGRTLLVIDDVQWADSGSLALTAHLAAAPALTELTILGIVRSTDLDSATAGALSALRRHATLERISLGGLRGGDIAELVRSVAGADVSPAFVDTIAAATDGNPLFVAELTEHLLELDWQPDAGGAVPVPIGVRETLAERLATLTPAAQSLIRGGAVLGRTFETDVAAQLGEVGRAHVVEATEDALLSGLVFEDSALSLTFSHALVQSAVYESMSARRRLDLHRSAALALEARLDPAHADDVSVYDIARHWALVAAEDRSALDDAVRWAIRAGDAAAAAADIAEAVRRYQWAAEQWTEPTGERTALLLKLGAAHSAASDIAAADEQFWAALHLADDLGEPRLYADAAIGLAATVRFGHHDPDRINALERAIRDVPPEEHVRRVTAAAMLKRQLGFEASDSAYQRRQVAAAMVLDAVSAETVSDELLTSLGSARDSIVVDDPVVLERVSRQMIAVATRQRNLPMLANAWYGKAWAAMELADAAGWHEATTAFAAVAAELGLPYELALSARMDAATALMEGRFDDAEQLGQRSLELAADIDPNANAIHLSNAVIRGIEVGQAAETLEVMLAVRDDLESVPTFLAGLAMTAAIAGRADVAVQVLDHFADANYQNLRRDLEWLPVIGLLCHACVTIGEPRYAGGLYEQLASHPARAVRVGPLGAWWGPTDFYLGGLARLLGRTDEARVRLRRAVETCSALRAVPWLARAEQALSDCGGDVGVV